MSEHIKESPCLTLNQVGLAFGHHPLLVGAQLALYPNERVCLIGRNGEGKSSLLKILDGAYLPDQGTVWRRPALRVGRLIQELPLQSTLTVYEFVAEGLAELGTTLAQYHHLTQSLTNQHGDNADILRKLESLQQILDQKQGWQIEHRIQEVLLRLNLEGDAPLSSLSGGWIRRAALAQVLVKDPEVLLLDEPTNHLDIAAIEWLEEFLKNYQGCLVFITHDRAFLKALATRILELDRGQLTSWPGDYANFLRRREERWHQEEQENQRFDKKLGKEETWIRQGIKARRTRNEGRVRALQKMRVERAKRREQMQKPGFMVSDAIRSGELVFEAEHLSYHIQGKPVIHDFSTRIMRGERIGLLGPNGVGKSTLLKLLLGGLTPSSGHVRQGTTLKLAYFDQTRATLQPEMSVRDHVAPGSDFVEIGGQKQHVMGYLAHFLFSPERALSPVKILSGGEQNRLVLAQLFSQPSNVLILDEPTNDLDIETLELLEAQLSEYRGTLLLVSHDRFFLEQVTTSLLVFSGDGWIEENVGGYDDWLRSNINTVPQSIKQATKPAAAISTSLTSQKSASKKELLVLLQKIEKLEVTQKKYHEQIAAPGFYQRPPAEIEQTLERLKEVEAQIAHCETRWSELER